MLRMLCELHERSIHTLRHTVSGAMFCPDTSNAGPQLVWLGAKHCRRSWISTGPGAVLWHARLRRALHRASASGVSAAAGGHALLLLLLRACSSPASPARYGSSCRGHPPSVCQPGWTGRRPRQELAAEYNYGFPPPILPACSDSEASAYAPATPAETSIAGAADTDADRCPR